MARRLRIGPEVITANLTSSNVFFGFYHRSMRTTLRNLDVSSDVSSFDIKYAFSSGADANFATLRSGDTTVIEDIIYGINLKAIPGTTSTAEIITEPGLRF